ncbi:MAG: Fic family protein [Thermoleophilia bacterium]|nr:Fic family protein [Thermoleophilia bacterium]
MVRRRWFDVAALKFPGAVIVDRSAHDGQPAEDGSLFLDVGPERSNRATIEFPGLRIKPREGPGRVTGDTEFIGLFQSSPARIALDNLRPSRARSGVARTLSEAELEDWLERMARIKGEQALNELRDKARAIAPTLGASSEFKRLDLIVGALLGTQDAELGTSAGRARQRGAGYDPSRLDLFETLRAELASEHFAARPAPSDPKRLGAFFEAYFSNWIEGTEFEVDEAESIVFEGKVPPQRPADAHDIRGTFDAVISPRFTSPATNADSFIEYLSKAHEQIMGGRPEVGPGVFKDRANRVGSASFVSPELVRGTLVEGFRLLETLPAGMPRAVFSMFLVSEVHPFSDGNGRVARLAMNAELSAQGLCRIMIPPVFRDEYMSGLRALTSNRNPTPIWRTLDRAQRWASILRWEDHDEAMSLLERSNAFVTPEEANSGNVHLVDPSEPSYD